MSKFKNISPYGDLDVPTLGLIVKAGAVVDVPDGIILAPTDFEPVTDDTATPADAATSKTPASPDQNSTTETEEAK